VLTLYFRISLIYELSALVIFSLACSDYSDFPAQKKRQNFPSKHVPFFQIFLAESFSTRGIQAQSAFGNIVNVFAQLVWKNGMVLKVGEKYIRQRFQ
jgi:hypothetical protein